MAESDSLDLNRIGQLASLPAATSITENPKVVRRRALGPGGASS